MRKYIFTLVIVGLSTAFLATDTSQAITIEYDITDLPDTKPGEDLWQYNYRVSNYNFNAGHGFTIYFDQAHYKNIEKLASPVNEDWDIIVWQPDVAIPDDGAYDALFTSESSTSLTDGFTMSFIWLGNGSPGPQRFDIYDPNFKTLESGQSISSRINPWDINGDSKVDILDLVFVGSQFGAATTDNTADVNDDSTVDILDLVLISRHLGENYDSVPMAPILTDRNIRLESK